LKTLFTKYQVTSIGRTSSYRAFLFFNNSNSRMDQVVKSELACLLWSPTCCINFKWFA